MLRATVKNRFICASFFPFISSKSRPNGDTKTETIDAFQNQVIVERLKGMLLNENGYPNRELQSVINTTMAATMTGFFVGGIRRSQSTVEIVAKENQATLYKNKVEAYREVYTKGGYNFVKGGVSLAAKLGFFCFIFSSTSTGLHVYRKKFDVLNHICAGALTGFLFRVNMGIKGAIAGTVLGTILGIASGLFTMFLFLITGYDLSDLHDANAAIADLRRQQIKKMAKSFVNKEEMQIQHFYEANKEATNMLEKQKIEDW